MKASQDKITLFKHISIHCRNYSTARHALIEDQRRLPDLTQLLTTPVADRKSSSVLLDGESGANPVGPGTSSTHRGPLPPPTTELDNQLGRVGHSNSPGQQKDAQEEAALYSPEDMSS
jgi:hypothetical protein